MRLVPHGHGIPLALWLDAALLCHRHLQVLMLLQLSFNTVQAVLLMANLRYQEVGKTREGPVVENWQVQCCGCLHRSNPCIKQSHLLQY